MDYSTRHKKIKNLLALKSLDALLIRKKENIFYLTGARGEDSVMIVSMAKNLIITDARYTEEYARSAINAAVITTGDKNAPQHIGYILKKMGAERAGFEADHFTYSEVNSLKKYIRDVSLLPVKGVVESLRAIKDLGEIQLIREACVYGVRTMAYAIKTARPSFSERFVKQKIEAYMLKKGIAAAGFEIIVASGKNASMPHATASGKKIRKEEMVVIDLGAMNYGYNSDLTRTVFLGRIERKYSRMYNIVLDAQKKAIDAIKPGVMASVIDNISRRYISEKGFGRYFVHSLGHGIGLEPHEEPRLSGKSTAILEKGMTITVEPGIYIPRWGGIRIEDVILVTERGCEVLTKGL